MMLTKYKAELAEKAGQTRHAYRRAQMAERQVFFDFISDPDLRDAVNRDPETFHEVLLEAESLGYVHYSRLAAGMGLSDPSNCSRWFKPADSKARKSPDQFRRRFAIAALARIVERDLHRLGAGLDAIGGLSMRDYPELEFDIPQDAA